MYTMSGKEITVDETHKLNGKTWWEQRPAMLQMPASSWVSIKAWIIKSCKKMNCDSAVTSWERTLETVDSNVQKKMP